VLLVERLSQPPHEGSVCIVGPGLTGAVFDPSARRRRQSGLQLFPDTSRRPRRRTITLANGLRGWKRSRLHIIHSLGRAVQKYLIIPFFHPVFTVKFNMIARQRVFVLEKTPPRVNKHTVLRRTMLLRRLKVPCKARVADLRTAPRTAPKPALSTRDGTGPNGREDVRRCRWGAADARA